jgi:hypothetical protein
LRFFGAQTAEFAEAPGGILSLRTFCISGIHQIQAFRRVITILATAEDADVTTTMDQIVPVPPRIGSLIGGTLIKQGLLDRISNGYGPIKKGQLSIAASTGAHFSF